MMVLRMFGTTVYASGNLTPNELMHVRPPHAGGIACSESFYLLLLPLRL